MTTVSRFRRALAPLVAEPAQPFPFGFVECRNRGAGSEPQHVAQAMRLPGIERSGGPGANAPGM